MKKLKLFCTILIGLLLFSSCRDEESTDISVGQWLAIQKLEMNEVVAKPVCLTFTYFEHKANKSGAGGNIDSPNFLDQCNALNFDFILWRI
jgi:hypothetical protein